jgi:hypothetical protein
MKKHARKTSKALSPSPELRARICERIGYQLALEIINRTNHRREAWARICIGLRPFPRRALSDRASIRWEP